MPKSLFERQAAADSHAIQKRFRAILRREVKKGNITKEEAIRAESAAMADRAKRYRFAF